MSISNKTHHSMAEIDTSMASDATDVTFELDDGEKMECHKEMMIVFRLFLTQQESASFPCIRERTLTL